MSMEPVLHDRDGRMLFAILDRPEASIRGALLICPPLLHEHVRAYRLFALLAAALAERGVAVLRFDYYGTGDSAGECACFELDGAEADARFMLEHLAADRLPDLPKAVLGVRAGALIAARIAAEAGLPLALWQPVLDGAAWLAELLDQTRREQRSTARFPFLAAGAEAAMPENCLMGFETGPALLASLRARALWPTVEHGLVILDDREPDAALAGGHWLRLDPELADWAGRIDIKGFFRARDVAPVAERLIAALGWEQS